MPNVLSIFSGGGGIDCGFKKAGFDICLYTGFERKYVPTNIVNKLHFLKTGSFDSTKIYPPKPFVGSSNQNFSEI